MINPVLLTQSLIKCNSVTPNHDGAFDILASNLQSIGFEVNVFECKDLDGSSVTNLYAKYGNSDDNILGFVGHVDVVPAGDITKWISDPFLAEIKDERIIGRGAADMKSAIACFISAADRFIKENAEFPGQIVFLITGDEEEGSPQGMRSLINWCIKNKKMPSYCLIGEPSCNEVLGEAYLKGRRGSINVFVKSNGEQGHVAHPEFASNAITTLISYLNTLLAKKWDSGSEDFEPTHLELTSVSVDNDVNNIIPGKAEASFNIRFNKNYTGESLSKILKDMASLVSSRLEVTTKISGEPFLCESEFIEGAIKKAINEVTGIEPKALTVGGISDGRFLVEHCQVIEFGMPYNTIHKENECVSLSDIEQLTNIYYSFLKNVFENSSEIKEENT